MLEDRTINVILEHGKKPEIINSEVKPESPVWQQIRDMIHVFYMEHFSVVSDVSPEGTLKERERELWKPVLALAKYFNQ